MYRTLEFLRGISPEECASLRGRGIRQTNQLLHHLMLEIDRRTVSRRTGIPEPRLLQLARQCALLEISGMHGHLNVIHRLGIDGLKRLKREDSVDLHRRISEAVGPAVAPSLSTVEYWISQARSIDVLEEEEPSADGSSPSLLASRPRQVVT